MPYSQVICLRLIPLSGGSAHLQDQLIPELQHNHVSRNNLECESRTWRCRSARAALPPGVQSCSLPARPCCLAPTCSNPPQLGTSAMQMANTTTLPTVLPWHFLHLPAFQSYPSPPGMCCPGSGCLCTSQSPWQRRGEGQTNPRSPAPAGSGTSLCAQGVNQQQLALRCFVFPISPESPSEPSPSSSPCPKGDPRFSCNPPCLCARDSPGPGGDSYYLQNDGVLFLLAPWKHRE